MRSGCSCRAGCRAWWWSRPPAGPWNCWRSKPNRRPTTRCRPGWSGPSPPGWPARRRLGSPRSRRARARDAFAAEHDREPTSAELAHRLGIGVEEVVEGLAAAAGYTAASLDAPATDDGPTEVHASRASFVDPGYDLAENLHALKPLIAALPHLPGGRGDLQRTEDDHAAVMRVAASSTCGSPVPRADRRPSATGPRVSPVAARRRSRNPDSSALFAVPRVRRTTGTHVPRVGRQLGSGGAARPRSAATSRCRRDRSPPAAATIAP
ncbi:sigma-70 domain-containing protein [Embleya sp. NPDC008237]|uniref:sigma-70 domain-containing protein n=1 Tax=Embleya sp. NPDC008237 TaxID=3363978 RepID=UPI0036DFDB8A